jgi:hypothetical protein
LDFSGELGFIVPPPESGQPLVWANVLLRLSVHTRLEPAGDAKKFIFDNTLKGVPDVT